MKLNFRRSGRAVRPLSKVWRRLFWFPFLSAVLMTGCSRPVESPHLVEVEHEISPQPARVGPATITLKLANAAAQPVTGAHITCEADMSHAGMSPVFGAAKEAEPGRYQAQLVFGMAGDWVILLHILLPGGQKLERQFDVRGVRPN